LVWLVNPLPRLKRSRVLEGAALVLLEVWLGRMVFLGKSPFGPTDYPLEYLAILPLLWAAFRFGERGALTFSFIMSSLALWGTRHGYGPFHRGDANESLILLQTFMGTITLTTLVLASIISERQRIEERLEIQDAVSRVLAEAPSLREATPRLFKALCQKGEWEVGSIWSIDHDANELNCAETWHAKQLEVPQFEAATRQIRMARGVGLPGRVWTEGKPVWVRDVVKDANFPRAAAAFEDGLRSAFCFPLKLGEEVVGIVECFSRRIREPDEDFLHLLTSLGSQLGQYIERKRAEEDQAMLASIVSSSDDAIISKTLEARITSWNKGAERVFGYSAAEAVGREISIIIPSDRLTEEHDILQRIRRGEPIRHYHTVRLRKDGKLIDVSLSISPIRDATGTIIGASKIARDITHEKKTERALAHAQEELKQYAGDLEQRVQERTAKLRETIQSLDGFCYSIAHDLRAPLRALGGFSAELTENYSQVLDEVGNDYLQRIQAAAKRMDQLILDLLQFGRLNTAELPASTVQLDEIISKVLVPLDEEIKTKQARVKLKSPLIPVRANPVMVEQVLVNLIGNALKFVPPKAAPKIELWTEAHDSMVRLYVKDNGIGIKPNHMNKLFQPFVRLVNGTEFPGTGIGLAIVRKGVERMGGKVGVESELGKGSCFWIDLPAASPDKPA
ncbi:MAG TPA: PAS domain S-box protein, partial [Candidatus Eisenbacteria bacterium]|nr:PAS domain S-box protein [Candidatus Eisenbacteria bacterium]